MTFWVKRQEKIVELLKKFAKTRTEWGSWGHTCIAESRAGIQQTPFCLWVAQSPCFHSQETCRLQTERQAISSSKSFRHLAVRHLFTHQPRCSPYQSHSIWCFQESDFCWQIFYKQKPEVRNTQFVTYMSFLSSNYLGFSSFSLFWKCWLP